jgi:hypothetical protein
MRASLNSQGRAVMGNRWDYLRNPRELDGWLKANAVVGSMVAINILAMALAGLNSTGLHDGTVEVVSSATADEVQH